MMRRRHVAVALVVLLGTSAAHADESGDKALAAVAQALSKASTHYFEYAVSNQEGEKPERQLALTVRQKGDSCLMEFTAPADMKGTKVLLTAAADGQPAMYAYLPAFGKVRRVARDTLRERGFMGMAFSPDDLVARYRDYTATASGETLVLTPKPETRPAYSKIEMTLTKDKLPLELKYFAGETHLKTETRSGYSCQKDVCTPAAITVIDVGQHLTTKLTRSAWKVNEAMPDDVFSKKALEH